MGNLRYLEYLSHFIMRIITTERCLKILARILSCMGESEEFWVFFFLILFYLFYFWMNNIIKQH